MDDLGTVDEAEQVWRRATAIQVASELRTDTKPDITAAEVHARADYRALAEARQAEDTLKRQLLELYIERKRYIEAIDRIYELNDNKEPSDSELWKQITAILMGGGDEFAVEVGS
jgi:hypothetical protein